METKKFENITPSDKIAVDVSRAINLPNDMSMVCCQNCNGLLTLTGSVFCGNDECESFQYCKYCLENVSECTYCKKPIMPCNISKQTLKFMQNLKIQCNHIGCNQNILYANLEKHEEECGFKDSSCPYCLKCDIKSVIDQHMKTCDLRDFICNCHFEGAAKNDHSCDSVRFLMKKLEEQDNKHKEEITELKKLTERLSNRLQLLEGLQGAIPSAEEFLGIENYSVLDQPLINSDEIKNLNEKHLKTQSGSK